MNRIVSNAGIPGFGTDIYAMSMKDDDLESRIGMSGKAAQKVSELADKDYRVALHAIETLSDAERSPVLYGFVMDAIEAKYGEQPMPPNVAEMHAYCDTRLKGLYSPKKDYTDERSEKPYKGMP
jgi:hypothetical protein